MKTLLLVLTLAMFTHNSMAQQSSFSCFDVEGYDGFDFWLGQWEVKETSDGVTVAGQNRIVREQDGCVVMEYWTSNGGVTGQSMNVYNPETKTWHQTWMSSNGSYIVLSGGATPTGIRMQGTIDYISAGVTAKLRGEWTALENGTIRQFFEQYNEEAGVWQVWFDGTYTRTN